jgi:LysM repeat protein
MRAFLMCLLALFLSACALEPASFAEEIVLTVVVNTPEPVLPTFTAPPPATATQALVSPSPTNQSAAVNTNCTARTDLPNYVVVAGDSLSSIAARTNSQVSQLVEWNCLTNANMIVVGMRLQIAREAVRASSTPTVVPTGSSTPTPSTDSANSRSITLGPFGALGLGPAIQAGSPADWTDFVIAPQASITIQWSGIDPEYYVEVGQIEFFYLSDSGTSISIGIDSDKSDGMSITWTAPSNVSGRITAMARYRVNDKIISPAIHVRDNG